MKSTLSIFLTLITMGAFAQNDGWHISTNQNIDYTGVVVSNGQLGILPSEKVFKTRQVIMNNVYDKESPLGVSRILLGIHFQNLQVENDGEDKTRGGVVRPNPQCKYTNLLN